VHSGRPLIAVAAYRRGYRIDTGAAVTIDDTAGTTPLVGLASDLKTNGYAIECNLTQLPTEKALVRSYARFFTEGRYVPPEYIAGVGDSPQGTFDRLRSEGLINRGSIVDTDVPRGQAPRLLESWPRKVAKAL
jgi:hypothetical protein